jgi:hypothetical protein
MMNQRMRLKRIAKFPQRPVHDIAMQDPFKKRRIDDGAEKTDGRPKHGL